MMEGLQWPVYLVRFQGLDWPMGAQVFERPLLWYMKVVWVEDRLGLESQVQDGNEQTTVAKLEI